MRRIWMLQTTLQRWLACLVFVGCFGGVGCAGTDGESRPQGDTGGATGGPDAGSGGFDGSAADADAGEEDGVSDTDSVRGIGTVRITQQPPDGSSDGQFTASARFYEGTEPIRDSCETTVEGNCELEVCQGGIDEQTEFVSIGAISIYGGRQSVELTPGPEKTYDANGTGAIWDASSVLTVDAEGETAPGFLEELEPDVETRLTKPWLPDSGEALRIDPTKNLPVEWTRENLNSGQFGAVLNTESDGRETTIECAWDAEEGSGAIASELLEQMARVEGFYEFTVGAYSRVEREGWRVTIEAWQEVDDGSEMTASGVGTLQFR